ncbi:S-adenosyl-L-methionine-dependent methyltransferase [Phellopilus nigrolimitatus]|nr:S-adenosyl-L-methionine-dependent methyltransferase [Phellopilus nigrolimitatus]
MTAIAASRTPDGLKDVHGRGMNIHSDAVSQSRLTIQHRMWKLMLGGPGLYPPEVAQTVARLLAPRENKRPAVLDVGTGSGIWAIEMAAMYPHARVVGLDLAAPKLHFVTADATKGLDAYATSFDLVHCRCVAGHVVDRAALVRVLASVLKPGGLLLLGDGNQELYAADWTAIPPADGPGTEPVAGSWLRRWLAEVIGRMLAGTHRPEGAGGDRVGALLRGEPSLAFAGGRAYYSPLHAPPDAAPAEQEVAHLAARNMLDFLAASAPLLLASGLPGATVGEWQRRARAEILESPVRVSMKWGLAWATKRA